MARGDTQLLGKAPPPTPPSTHRGRSCHPGVGCRSLHTATGQPKPWAMSSQTSSSDTVTEAPVCLSQLWGDSSSLH